MNRTFTKIMISYVIMATTIFLAIGSLSSSALSSSPAPSEARSWLAGFIVWGANYFIKLVLAFA
ncbi:MAG: hypothetical protein SCK57_01540 [Bacillota bacterium]|nr:hypothetical protein [Bacillota bacterium]MDW7676326.1 hypothetical protein [Bacillota bacterium]